MKPLKLTLYAADINHILAHLEQNRIDRENPPETSWYYGDKREFIKRHKRIKKKLGGGE